MRAKNKDGEWIEPFRAIEWGGPFTEGSSWHYTWSVMHDIQGLAQLMGGHEQMGAKLDSMFNAPADYNVGTYGFVIHEIAEMVALDMGQYAHGNQPVQHAIYLYNYIGQPWKAQYHVREVLNRYIIQARKVITEMKITARLQHGMFAVRWAFIRYVRGNPNMF